MAVKLPPEIQELDDWTESMNFLIHADTGAGKTVMAGKLPNALILATEEGTISAKRMGVGRGTKVWKIKHWDKLVEAYEWLRDNEHPFEWVIVDSITSAQTKCLRAIMENVVANNPHRDPDIPAPGDHFKWQLLMKRMVQDFNELPVNMLWLARSMNKEDPAGQDIVVPLIEGKDYQISAWVCGEMHLVAYLKKEAKRGKPDEMVRKLYTNEHAMYWCKDRYVTLAHVIVNPDINKIVAQIVASTAETPRRTAARKVAPRTARKRVASR